MNDLHRRARLFHSFTAACLTATLAAPSEAQRQDVVFEYAVKVICGPTQGVLPPIAPGRYFTAVNLHNPSDTTATLQFKVAISSKPHPDTVLVGGAVSGFRPSQLRPDQATEIDCAHVIALANMVAPKTSFVKGFVVIQSRSELDVVAVYTASGPTARVQTMTLERVAARRVPLR